MISNIRLIRNYPDAKPVFDERGYISRPDNHNQTWQVTHHQNGQQRAEYFRTLSQAKNFRKSLVKKRDTKIDPFGDDYVEGLKKHG
jgi:hypothetical protein